MSDEVTRTESIRAYSRNAHHRPRPAYQPCFDGPTTQGACDDGPVEHIADLVGRVRDRFRVEDSLDDAVIRASLAEIFSNSSRTDRWRADFNSTLGQWLALHGRDLDTSLSDLIAMLPPARY